MISYDGRDFPTDIEKLRMITSLLEGKKAYRAVYIKREAAEYLSVIDDGGEDIFSGKLCVLDPGEKLPKHFRVGQDAFLAKNLLLRTGAIYLIKTRHLNEAAMVITATAASKLAADTVRASLRDENLDEPDDLFVMSPRERSQVMRECFGIDKIGASVVNAALTCERTEEFLLICAAAELDLNSPGVKSIFKFDFDWELISKLAKAELERIKSIN